jgi:hypothetical protein
VHGDKPSLAAALPARRNRVPLRPVGAPERTSLVQINDCQ